MKSTTREKVLLQELKELRNRQTISLNEFDSFLDAIGKFVQEYYRLKIRFEKLKKGEGDKIYNGNKGK